MKKANVYNQSQTMGIIVKTKLQMQKIRDTGDKVIKLASRNIWAYRVFTPVFTHLLYISGSEMLIQVKTEFYLGQIEHNNGNIMKIFRSALL